MKAFTTFCRSGGFRIGDETSALSIYDDFYASPVESDAVETRIRDFTGGRVVARRQVGGTIFGQVFLAGGDGGDLVVTVEVQGYLMPCILGF